MRAGRRAAEQAAGRDAGGPGGTARPIAADGVPRLGEHEGGVSLLRERPGERGQDPGGPLRGLGPAHPSHGRPDLGSPGHDRVLLHADDAWEDRVHEDGCRAQGEGRALASAHPVRPAHACKPRRHARGPAPRRGRGEGLVARQVQGTGRARAQAQSDAHSHRGQGERPVARQSPTVDRVDRRARPLRSHRRPRERHLRAVLPRAGARHELPGPRLRRPPGAGRPHHHRAGDARRRAPAARTGSASATRPGGSRTRCCR